MSEPRPAATMSEETLRRMAEALRARDRSVAPTGTPALVVRIAEERVAIALDRLREVIAPPPKITSVPGSAPWLLGLAILHGEVRPVLDAARALGIPRTESAPAALVVARRTPRAVAIAVDAVEGARPISCDRETGAGEECAIRRVSADGVAWLELDDWLDGLLRAGAPAG